MLNIEPVNIALSFVFNVVNVICCFRHLTNTLLMKRRNSNRFNFTNQTNRVEYWLFEDTNHRITDFLPSNVHTF